ncbi:MAG: FecR domain-containing protein [Bacteroidales bacterium]|nr:FecR domain-containing protein [Bacteroidales bacterium]
MKTKEKYYRDTEDKEKRMFDEFLSGQNQSAQKYWKEMNEIGKQEKVDTDKAWNNLYNRLEDKGLINKHYPAMNRAFSIAATVVLIIGLSITALYVGTNVFGKKDLNIITAGTGQRNVPVILPDGSRVYLNRNTTLEYPDNFSRQTRTVRLEGEAFFDVVSRAGQDFIVDAGEANIKVLGTSFNVNAGDDGVEVFVTEGKVMLTNIRNKQSLTLEQGDLGSIFDESAVKNINTDPNYLAWKTDVLEFEGDRLEKVISDLKRVYDINIEILDEDINDLRVTSVFDKQAPDTIIRIICTTFNLEYYKEGNIYSLDKK